MAREARPALRIRGAGAAEEVIVASSLWLNGAKRSWTVKILRSQIATSSWFLNRSQIATGSF